MTSGGRSFEKVHFEFRPNKQVERKMLLETFLELMSIGFPIRGYTYAGMGSVYYIDFILFYKYLGMARYISVEVEEDIEKRVAFNKPFGKLKTYPGDIGDHLALICGSEPCVLWLDYDTLIDYDKLGHIRDAVNLLACGSILLVTIDIEPPGRKESGPNNYNTNAWKRFFMKESKEFMWSSRPSQRDFSRTKMGWVNARIIYNAILNGLVGRDNTQFFPLFNFAYSDGHKMATFGGMIGTLDDGKKLKRISRKKCFFLRKSLLEPPYEIRVPLLTRKEKLFLDGEMPCRKNWRPKAFEMDCKDVLAYRELYKYYPAYTEMLL